MENDTSPARPGAGPTPARKRRTPAPREWWLTLAALISAGKPVTEAAREVGRSRQACHGVMRDPRWAGLLERAEADARAEATRLLGMYAPAAVRALGAAAEGGDTDAARALLAAGAPPSERQREAARRDLLRALSPGLARQVAAELSGTDEAWLRSLTDEELARMLEDEP